jgi:predicted ATPase/DNA-binding SARP family transcriptional activator
VEFRILGALEVSHQGSTLSLGGPRHRRLLAVLLLSSDEVVSTGRLIEALWGDAVPKSAAAVVHVRVSELRAMLRAARPERNAGLLTRSGGYVLQVGADSVDAHRFERLAAAGAQDLDVGDYAGARAHLSEGLALWRGEALADVADEPFARAEAARLEELRLQALENRLEADLALGNHRALVGELETLVALHPLREHFWHQFMLALYRAGRQSEALRAYQVLRHLLADQLGIDPGAELQQLLAAILRQDQSLELPARVQRSPPTGNLPAPITSFVGRHGELVEICALLRSSRLVTLTGVGGAGKSRLAVEVAATCRSDFPDGTWLVELAALNQPGLVVHAVAAAFGVREHPNRPLIEVLVERLHTVGMLLVLDNCEHVVAEAAEMANQLLRRCPGLRILATSRERLGITGEVLRPVAGLGVPDSAAVGAGVIGRAEAVRLLVERATAVQPGFVLSEATAFAAAQICQRLDGLPLAIELAAARMNAFTVDQVAARLDDRFRLLSGGSRTALARHQTLRATVDWSYGHLGDDERRLFDRLGVFVGGFTLEAVESVCAEGLNAAVTDSLARLVDKSLVVVETSQTSGSRYRMLETLRAFAFERLEESGDTARLRDRHASHVVALIESAGADLHGAQQLVWLPRLEAEHGNIRAALDWSILRGDAVTAMRLAGSLYPLWDGHGHYREGRRWLRQVLAMDAAVPPAVKARVLDSAAGLAVVQGDLEQAAAAAEKAAALSRKAGDPAGEAHALQHLGLAAVYADDVDRAVGVLEEAVRGAREAADPWLVGFALLFLTTAALAEGDYRRTMTLSAECEAVLRPVGDPEGLAWTVLLRGAAAWRTHDLESAAVLVRKGLSGFNDLAHLWGTSLGLFLAAQLAAARGRHEQAISLLAVSGVIRDSVGAAVLPFVERWIETAVIEARAVLDAATFDRAWRAGQSMEIDAAVAHAMREIDLAERDSLVKG